MRAHEFLIEYNLAALQKQFADKITSRLQGDRSTNSTSLQELLSEIEEPLKTNNTLQIINPYIKWIIAKYANEQIRYVEDIHSKAIPSLLKYDALKRKKKLKSEHTDVNRFKSLNDLMDVTDEYTEKVTSKKDETKAIEQKFYESGEAELIYNDSEIKVVVPKSERASCFFGRNTRWCTAATGGQNYFDSYNKKGNLYIVLIKKENKRFQFHFKKSDFMDELDQPINPNKLAAEYPKLWDIFTPIAESNNSIVLNKNPSEASKLATVSYNGLAIQYIENPSEAVQLAALAQRRDSMRFIENPSEDLLLTAVKKDPHLIMYIENPSEAVQLSSVTRYGQGLGHIKNPSEAVKLAAVKNDGTAIYFIENPSEELQIAAVTQRRDAIQHIKNPSEKVKQLAKS
jgi:hypothetical protein